MSTTTKPLPPLVIDRVIAAFAGSPNRMATRSDLDKLGLCDLSFYLGLMIHRQDLMRLGSGEDATYLLLMP